MVHHGTWFNFAQNSTEVLKPRNGRVFYDREMFILLHIVI